jgi:hypothetical protein
MEWTPENDAKLTEMHAKRLSVRFIADWMRWPAAAVRARLIELGLTKPMTPRASAVVARAAGPVRAAAEIDLDREDDEDDLRGRPGCPRGHLLPEAKIAELYNSVGGSYR